MSLFFRYSTDHAQQPIELENLYLGSQPSPCWVIGGGPALGQLPCDDIAHSPVPKLALNLAGARLIRPNFWTSYDPSKRFHRSIYLDAGILKFVHRRRALDLIPETTLKVCDGPGVCCFERQSGRTFRDWLTPGATALADWTDSFLQGIELCYRLGFRVLYLAGCDLHVQPAPEIQAWGAAHGVVYRPRELLGDFHRRCLAAGLSRAELLQRGTSAQYHFEEAKSLAAAEQTDLHYFRVSQLLRLSRRWQTLAGLQLISVTPGSRLNDYFEYQTVATVLQSIHQQIGNPAHEPTRGLYTERVPRSAPDWGPMKDMLPPVRPLNPAPPARSMSSAPPERSAGSAPVSAARPGPVAVSNSAPESMTRVSSTPRSTLPRSPVLQGEPMAPRRRRGAAEMSPPPSIAEEG